MSLRVIGYDHLGKRIVEDEGPQTARARHHTWGTRAFVGGSLVQGTAGAVEMGRIQTREHMRKRRAEGQP